VDDSCGASGIIISEFGVMADRRLKYHSHSFFRIWKRKLRQDYVHVTMVVTVLENCFTCKVKNQVSDFCKRLL